MLHCAMGIWVIEDDPHQMELLLLSIKALPVCVPVVAATDGASAWGRLACTPPDQLQDQVALVLLDLRLPGLHGLELLTCAERVGLTSRLPFVVLSSADSAEDRARALALGARDYLVKPLGYRPLQHLLRSLYERWLAPRLAAAAAPVPLSASRLQVDGSGRVASASAPVPT
jgi:DNA-binding response OmpR family regulator